MIDFRYIYLMERTTKKSLWARLSFQDEIKIGIAKNPKWRRKDIEDDLPGDVRIILAKKVLFTGHFEQRLHKIFSDSRFRINGGKNAGRTEWFYCTPLERIFLEAWVYWLVVRPYIVYPIRLALLLFFIYLIMQIM